MPEKKIFRVRIAPSLAIVAMRGSGDMNYHGRPATVSEDGLVRGATIRSGHARVRLGTLGSSKGWRFIRYRPDGSWSFVDVVLDRRPSHSNAKPA